MVSETVNVVALIIVFTKYSVPATIFPKVVPANLIATFGASQLVLVTVIASVDAVVAVAVSEYVASIYSITSS